MHTPFENSMWIGTKEQCVSPVILRRFTVSDITKATLSITGLGYFNAKINDSAVTDQLFLPVATDYEPRDLSKFLYPLRDTTTHRIYYYDFDITKLLCDGENTLSIQLGNGWYRQEERVAEGSTSFGKHLKTIYTIQIETADGKQEIFSDGSEVWSDSPLRYSNLFYGEVVDLTASISEEKAVEIFPSPASALCAARGTPDRIIRTLQPVLLGHKDGKAIFDAGENISGVVRVETSAASGSRITLRFSENLCEDLTLDFHSTGSGYKSPCGKQQIMEDTFITDGEKRTFMPQFVWHAFRYFEIDGAFDTVQVCVIHSDTPITSTLSVAHEGMNFLYDAFLRTQLNNMHGSHPSDCPHRERLGYTGDGQACAPAAMLLLDSRKFYEKWIRDILDCQDTVSGHVQHTAPLMGGGGGPGGWGSAIVTVPYAYYKQYGDVAMLQACYAPIKKWISYLIAHAENGLVTHEEEGGWCLGDWCTPEPIVLPEIYVNSCYLVKNLLLAEEIAGVIGEAEDIPAFVRQRQETEAAIKSRFFDPATGSFAGGVQGADAYAVWCGLAGRETADRLAEKYAQLKRFDTGFLCTDILMEVLFAYGHSDVAVSLLEGEQLGSFLYMKRHGATTLWEDWDGCNSHDHPMFGACVRQLFTGVLGIRQREGTAGYTDVIIAPQVPAHIPKIAGSILTPQGRISVSLDRTGAQPLLTVQAPPTVKITYAD